MQHFWLVFLSVVVLWIKKYRKQNKTPNHHNCVHYLTMGPWDTQAGPTNCTHQQTNKQTNLTMCGKIPIKTETPHPKRVQKADAKLFQGTVSKLPKWGRTAPQMHLMLEKWNTVVANNWDNQNYWENLVFKEWNYMEQDQKGHCSRTSF